MIISMPTFPKNIFQVWFQGCESVAKPKFIESMKGWAALNPTWNYACMSDTDLRKACRRFSRECLAVYDSLPAMHMKIDLGRYVLVYLHGGIYVDMDAYPLRGLEYSKHIQNAIRVYERENKHVLAISEANVNGIESFVSGVYYNNAFMMSSPRNPLMKRFIENVLRNCKAFARGNGGVREVQETTGPRSFSDFFRRVIKQSPSAIIVFPSVIVEPCDLSQTCRPNEESIALHQYEFSWIRDSRLVMLLKLYYKYIRNNIMLFVIILSIVYMKFFS